MTVLNVGIRKVRELVKCDVTVSSSRLRTLLISESRVSRAVIHTRKRELNVVEGIRLGGRTVVEIQRPPHPR
jgi:hypothetical protein